MTIRGVLFDMDGVLCDGQETHRAALEAAIESVLGVVWAGRAVADRTVLEGLPTKVKLRKLGIPAAAHEPISTEKQSLTLLAAYAYPRDAERIRMLRALRARGYRIGCYTNSIRKTAEAFLESAGLLTELDLLKTNEDVTYPKPDPQGYVEAMAELFLSPSETLIVEDSPTGLLAARSSGAYIMQTDFETLNLEGVLECLFDHNS